MNDVVLVMQSMSNSDKYGLTGTDPNHITEDGQNRAMSMNMRPAVSQFRTLPDTEILLTDVASLDPKIL